VDFSADQSVSTSTLEYLVAKTVDTILSFSPSILFFLGSQKRWAGSNMKFPIKYASSTQGMSFNGLERFSTTATENFINMTFDPTGREMPTVISQMKADVNETNAVINLIARQMSSDAQDMANDIAGLFWTLQTGKNFLSLLDALDDGSLGATSYGGLLRSTYTGIKGNYTGTIGNLTLSVLRTAYNNATHGPDSPNLILCPKAVWAYYEKLLTPTLSNQVTNSSLLGYPKFTGAGPGGTPNIVAPGTDLKGYQGFSAIYFNGVPVVADEKMTAGYLAMLNTRTINFYGLPSTHPDYKSVKINDDSMDSVYNIPAVTGFSFSGYNTPIDQYGRVGHIILMGNLICNNPRLNSLLTGITGA
jgi:hypothetical protein